MKNNFSIIISNTSRSYQYLKQLKKNKLIPKNIVYLNDGSNNPMAEKIKSNKFFFPEIIVKSFNTNYINKNVAKFLLSKDIFYIIYSGYPGVIERNKKILKLKKLIHSHSGKLPQYRGSTTIYYSILKEKKIYCSTIILNNNLDCGNILLIKKYPIPQKISQIDKDYDDKIRANNIVYTLKNFKKFKMTKKNTKKNNPYYVIHPILRSLVFRKYAKNL
jgi:methionyl-tRNA formyltransferase